MKCPVCETEITNATATDRKSGLFSKKFTCGNCSTRLEGNKVSGALQPVAALLFFGGILGFSGSYPMPQLSPVVAVAMSVVGFFLFIVSMRIGKYASVVQS